MIDDDYIFCECSADDEPGLTLLTRLLAIENELGRALRPSDIPADVMGKVMEFGDLHYERATDLSRVLHNICRQILTK